MSTCKLKTKVVNLRVDAYDVYIGRAGKGQKGYFGNPFKLEDFDNNRMLCILAYKRYFDARIAEDTQFRVRILKLKGKVLGCFCKPQLCHGDVIAEWLDSKTDSL